MHTKDPVVHIQVWWIMKTPKITQHAHKKCQSLQHDEVGLCMEEEGVHKELHHDECNWSPDKG